MDKEQYMAETPETIGDGQVNKQQEEKKNTVLNILFAGSELKDDSGKINIIFKSALRKAISSENLIVLFGAGASIDDHCPSMKELWKEFNNLSDKDEIKDLANYGKNYREDNLEELLSHIAIKKKFFNLMGEKDNEKKCDEYEKKIKDIIICKCSQEILESSPYKILLQRIIKARKMPLSRLKVFTLNYDTLVEQACMDMGIIVNDGFAFTGCGSRLYVEDFDLDIIQRERARLRIEEHHYEKLIHLYKIHGSLNWKKDGKNVCKFDILKSLNVKDNKNGGKEIIREIKPGLDLDPLLIYPNSNKYEETYRMPFFEMGARFQQELRKQNVTLFVIGYGFGDDHINQMIREAIEHNPFLTIFVVSPSIKDPDKDASDKLKEASEFLKKRIDANMGDTYIIGNYFSDFVKEIPDTNITHLDRYSSSDILNISENQNDESLSF